MSRGLEADAARTRESLTSKTGEAFDRAYIANEVEYHAAVLSALDDLLIPGARNEELRQALLGVRPAIEAHLRHAEQLQQDLGS